MSQSPSLGVVGILLGIGGMLALIGAGVGLTMGIPKLFGNIFAKPKPPPVTYNITYESTQPSTSVTMRNLPAGGTRQTRGWLERGMDALPYFLLAYMAPKVPQTFRSLEPHKKWFSWAQVVLLGVGAYKLLVEDTPQPEAQMVVRAPASPTQQEMRGLYGNGNAVVERLNRKQVRVTIDIPKPITAANPKVAMLTYTSRNGQVQFVPLWSKLTLIPAAGTYEFVVTLPAPPEKDDWRIVWLEA